MERRKLQLHWGRHCMSSIQYLWQSCTLPTRIPAMSARWWERMLCKWMYCCFEGHWSLHTHPAWQAAQSSLRVLSMAEEMVETSQKKWDFMVIAPTCLEPSEFPTGGFKNTKPFLSAGDWSHREKTSLAEKTKSLHLLFLSVLRIISSYCKAKFRHGWIIILTIKQNPKSKQRKRTRSALWRSNCWEWLRTEQSPQKQGRWKSIQALSSIAASGEKQGSGQNRQLPSCQCQPSPLPTFLPRQWEALSAPTCFNSHPLQGISAAGAFEAMSPVTDWQDGSSSEFASLLTST